MCSTKQDKFSSGSAFFAALVLVVISIFTVRVDAQTSKPLFGLQRSQSDPRFNRNNENFRRQSSFSYRDHCKTNYKFDYIQLTLMWPPGSCSTSPKVCIREVNNHFTIHGMWPTIKGTEEPSNCCFDNTFDFRALEPIMPILNEYWFSYYDTKNYGFWSHEWLKHGTCGRDVPKLRGEANYFENTVNLGSKLPILQVLRNASITPDNQKVYKSIDIYNALQSISFGKVLQIDCDYEHNQPIPILTGVNFCYDDKLLPMDCPEMKRKCQRQLIFPATSSRTFKPYNTW